MLTIFLLRSEGGIVYSLSLRLVNMVCTSLGEKGSCIVSTIIIGSIGRILLDNPLFINKHMHTQTYISMILWDKLVQWDFTFLSLFLKFLYFIVFFLLPFTSLILSSTSTHLPPPAITTHCPCSRVLFLFCSIP